MGKPKLFIETVTIENRQIRRGAPQFEDLKSHARDIEGAIAELTTVLGRSLVQPAASTPEESTNGAFGLSEVTAKFGLAVGAEGSIIVTKATFTASIEVEVKFTRER